MITTCNFFVKSKTTYIISLLIMLLASSSKSFSAHEGYVVCEGSGDPIGEGCFENWVFDEEVQQIARRVTNLYSVGCNLNILMPEWIGGCKIDLGDTFDVCRTSSGPCHRHIFVRESLLPIVEYDRAAPGGSRIDKKFWISYQTPTAPQVASEWVGCSGDSPVFGVTINGAGTRDTEFFEVEVQAGSSWYNIYDDYEGCLPDLFSKNTNIRIRALNLDGYSGWVNRTIDGSYNCNNPGGAF